jgi:hypothetical protein
MAEWNVRDWARQGSLIVKKEGGCADNRLITCLTPETTRLTKDMAKFPLVFGLGIFYHESE